MKASYGSYLARAMLNTVDTPSLIVVSTDWLLIVLQKHTCIVIAVQKSCIHASSVAVFVEWWIVVFVDIVSFHRSICTLGASLLLCFSIGCVS